MSLIPLSEIQIADLSKFILNPKFANLSDPGTRKTAVTNVYMQYLWTEKGVRSLFLMPVSLFDQNWASFFKFTDFQESDIAMVRGTPAQRQKIMASDAKVFIGSFNFFVPDKKEGISDYERLKKLHPDLDCLAVDEIHMGFRSMTAKRTLAFVGYMWDKKLGCSHFLPMTGTIVDGRLDTCYPMLAIIEPRYYYNYTVFLNEHALYDSFGGICAWKNVGKVKELLARHSVKHSFAEVHGPASLVIEHQPLIMGNHHKTIYDDYDATQTLEYNDEIKIATHEAEAVLRLRQICNCPEVLKLDVGELTKDSMMIVHFNAALEAKKAMVTFGAFNPEQERLAKLSEKEGLRTEIINGTVTPTKRAKITLAFQKGELDNIVASPATVAVGYDWSHVDYMVFSSMDYKDSSFVQGYHRAIRGKRAKPLLVYLPYYIDSIEEDILAAMEGKMSLANATDATRIIYKLRADRKVKMDKLSQMRASLKNYKQGGSKII